MKKVWQEFISMTAMKANEENSTKIFQLYKGVSKSIWTGCLERELQMVQLSATRCNYITILWVV
jgi:hypothetical protein